MILFYIYYYVIILIGNIQQKFVLFLKSALDFKPEFYAIFMILHTIFLPHALHDRLDDGKPDSGAAIFSGTRLIHLVKLVPDMFHAILRDRVTRIKYADAQYMLFLCRFDIFFSFLA